MKKDITEIYKVFYCQKEANETEYTYDPYSYNPSTEGNTMPNPYTWEDVAWEALPGMALTAVTNPVNTYKMIRHPRQWLSTFANGARGARGFANVAAGLSKMAGRNFYGALYAGMGMGFYDIYTRNRDMSMAKSDDDILDIYRKRNKQDLDELNKVLNDAKIWESKSFADATGRLLGTVINTPYFLGKSLITFPTQLQQQSIYKDANARTYFSDRHLLTKAGYGENEPLFRRIRDGGRLSEDERNVLRNRIYYRANPEVNNGHATYNADTGSFGPTNQEDITLDMRRYRHYNNLRNNNKGMRGMSFDEYKSGKYKADTINDINSHNETKNFESGQYTDA